MSAPSFFVYIDAPSGRGLEHPRHNPHYKQSTKVSLSEQTGILAASTMLAIPCSLAHKTQGGRDDPLAALPRGGIALERAQRPFPGSSSCFWRVVPQ